MEKNRSVKMKCKKIKAEEKNKTKKSEKDITAKEIIVKIVLT